MSSQKKTIDPLKILEDFASISSIGVFFAKTNGELLKLNNSLLELLLLKNNKNAQRQYANNAINLFKDKKYAKKIFQQLSVQNYPVIGCASFLKSDNTTINLSLNIQKITSEKKVFIVGYLNALSEAFKDNYSHKGSGIEMQPVVCIQKNFYYIKDIDGNLLSASEVFLDLMNLKGHEDIDIQIHTSTVNPFYSILHKKDLAFIERIKLVNNPSHRILSEKESNDNYIFQRLALLDKTNNLQSIVVFGSDFDEQAEEEVPLINSRFQQKAILDNIPYLAWLKDNKGKYLLVNEAFAKFFQNKPMQIIGKTDRDLFIDEIATKHERYDRAVKKAGKRRMIEDNWKTADGNSWFETFTAPIVADDGSLIGITGIARDISDRKIMEETIIKNEEHFRALLQYSSDAITILDSEGFVVFESSLRNRISDFTIDELVGKPYQDIIHPDDIWIFTEILAEVLKKPEIQIKREYRSLHKNKKWIYIESIFSNHLNNPSINGIVVNTRDVSDRKMSDLKERVYHDNLIFLSNSALDLLGLSDRDDIFKYIADKLHSFLEDSIVLVSSYSEEDKVFITEQITGLGNSYQKIIDLIRVNPIGIEYNRDFLLHNNENTGTISVYGGLIDDFNLDEINTTALKSALKMLRVNKIYNITMARDNKLLGNITILTLNKTIIKFKHIIETFVHQVSVALHRSQLEFELVKAKTKAEESDMLKTAFLTNMSHEIRTPMNGILGFAEMLNDENLSEGNRKKYVEIINNNGKMLMNLIDDIIDFAKIEAGQIKILRQEFSLNSLLTLVHASFLSESLKKEKNHVKLRIRKVLSNEDCFIQTDPNRLRQVLVNLVGNAFKFTQEGFIEFGYTLPKEGYLEFYVKDTGIGIPADKTNLIFDRFVQADYSRSRKYSGSGLGLAISKGFVELLGGKMRVESEVNVGSTFYFTIPYIPAAKKTQEEIESKKPKSSYNWHDKCFLIAEDDKFSFRLLEGFLKKTNAKILHAEDGIQAIDICKKNDKIDLILMDVQMPEMNGLEATKIIKQFKKDLPVIAQTANAVVEEKQKCFEAGFDDFVTKPINMSELFSKIEKWLTYK
jgi:PAS domain S-box-containing protein